MRKRGSIQKKKKSRKMIFIWLEKMKNEDEKRKMEELLHQQKVSQMIKSAEGSPQHGEEEHRSGRKKKRMPGCWTVVKQRGKMSQALAV